MTHHFLRAVQMTPAEIQFRERHKAARSRINAAADAYLKKLNQVAAQEAQASLPEQVTAPRLAEPSVPKKVFDGLDRIKTIQRLTCEAFEIGMAELMSQRRERKLVMARQIAMYLCKRFTSQSFPYIGRRFGRDHSTVMYGIARVQEIVLLPPEQRTASWSAGDCQKVRDKVAEITAGYLKSATSEDQP